MGSVELENARVVFRELAHKVNRSVKEQAAYEWSIDVLVAWDKHPPQKTRTLQEMASTEATQ